LVIGNFIIEGACPSNDITTPDMARKFNVKLINIGPPRNPNAEYIQIFVRTLTGLVSGRPSMIIVTYQRARKTFTCNNIDLSSLVWELKDAIKRKEGILVDHQRLIYTGKHLEDSRDLRSYNPSNICTVHQGL